MATGSWSRALRHRPRQPVAEVLERQEHFFLLTACPKFGMRLSAQACCFVEFHGVVLVERTDPLTCFSCAAQPEQRGFNFLLHKPRLNSALTFRHQRFRPHNHHNHHTHAALHWFDSGYMFTSVYGPLYLTATCSLLVCVRSTGARTFWEMTPGLFPHSALPWWVFLVTMYFALSSLVRGQAQDFRHFGPRGCGRARRRIRQ